MKQTIINLFQFFRLVTVIVSISIVHVPTAKAAGCKASFDILPPHVLGGPCPSPLNKEQNVLVTWPNGESERAELKGTGTCCAFCSDTCKPIGISCFDPKNEGEWPEFHVPTSDDAGNVELPVWDRTCSVSETDCEINLSPLILIPIPGTSQTFSAQKGADRSVKYPSPCPPEDNGGGGGGGGGYVCTPYYYWIYHYDCDYYYTECNYLGSSFGGYAGCW